jgi:putative endonuclease
MPKREYQFWVYILSNRSHILYIGVTNNLRKRIYQHRKQAPRSFTARYKVTRLLFFERHQYINNAIAREKELKHWTRAQKIALIESTNPTWEELMPDESGSPQLKRLSRNVREPTTYPENCLR